MKINTEATKQNLLIFAFFFIVFSTYYFFRLPHGIGFFEVFTPSLYNYHSESIFSLSLGQENIALTDTYQFNEKLFYSWGPLPGLLSFIGLDSLQLLSYIILLTFSFFSFYKIAKLVITSTLIAVLVSILPVFWGPIWELIHSDLGTLNVNTLYVLAIGSFFTYSFLKESKLTTSSFVCLLLMSLTRADYLFFMFIFILIFDLFAIRKINLRNLVGIGVSGPIPVVINLIKFGAPFNFGEALNKYHNDYFSIIHLLNAFEGELANFNFSNFIMALIKGESFLSANEIYRIDFQLGVFFSVIALGLFYRKKLQARTTHLFLFILFNYLFYFTYRYLETRYLIFLMPVTVYIQACLVNHTLTTKRILAVLYVVFIGFRLIQFDFNGLPHTTTADKYNLKKVFHTDFALRPNYLVSPKYEVTCNDLQKLSFDDAEFFTLGIRLEANCVTKPVFGLWLANDISKDSCTTKLSFAGAIDCSSGSFHSDFASGALIQDDNFSCTFKDNVPKQKSIFWGIQFPQENKFMNQLIKITRDC